MAVGGGDVHGPVAGAADVAGAAGFQRLVGADLVAELMAAAGGRIHGLAEFVIEALGGEIPFLLGDPFLQAEMRSDDEFCHGSPFGVSSWRFLLAFPLGVSSARSMGTDNRYLAMLAHHATTSAAFWSGGNTG